MKKLSYWEAELLQSPPELTIIGGGLTGMFAALSYHRLNPRHQIRILEQHPLSRTASTRNAGFLCFGSPSEILDDAGSMGWESAIELAKRRYKGMQLLLDTVSPQSIDYIPCGGYEVFHDSEISGKDLSELNDAFSDISSGLFTRSPEQLQSAEFIGFSDAIYNPLEGALHPAKLVMELKQKCLDVGIQLIEGVRVIDILNKGLILDEIVQEIPYDRILVATNALTNQLIPGTALRPARNIVMVVQPKIPVKWSGTYHLNKGYVYFRDIGGKVLIGGGRHIDLKTEFTDAFGQNAEIRAYLEQLLSQNILPGLDYDVVSIWSGILGVPTEGATKEPIVARFGEGRYLAARLSGMGVALSQSIGDDVAQMIHEDG